MIKFNFSMAVLVCLFLTFCNSNNESTKEADKKDTLATDNTSVAKGEVPEDTVGLLKSGDITLRPLIQSPDFPDAILELNKPEENGKLKPGYNVQLATENQLVLLIQYINVQQISGVLNRV